MDATCVGSAVLNNMADESRERLRPKRPHRHCKVKFVRFSDVQALQHLGAGVVANIVGVAEPA